MLSALPKKRQSQFVKNSHHHNIKIRSYHYVCQYKTKTYIYQKASSSILKTKTLIKTICSMKSVKKVTHHHHNSYKSINHHKHRIKSNTMLASSSTGYYHLSRSKSPIHYYTTAVASPSLPNKVVTTQTIPNLVSTTTTIATAASTTTSFTNHNSTSVIATFPEERATNKVNNNKELGIGLGVGIGCIAALGLVSLLFIHKRKKQQKEPMNNEREISSISTRWQPQNFMGVVASVVSKLPRTPSQSSKASTNNNVDIKSPKSIGIAIGHGEGAVEIDPSYSLPSHLASIDNERRY